MGKQVRFYALPIDEKLFWEFIQSIPETYQLSAKSLNSSVNSFVLRWSREPPKLVFRKYYIGKGKLDVLKTYVRKGSRKVYSEEKMDFVDTGEQFFWIDTNASLIEFIPSFFRDDGKLAQGRIWVDLYRLEEKEFVYKGDDFRDFYEKLANWIRKNFKKLKGVDGYFGKEALEWYKSGGEIL